MNANQQLDAKLIARACAGELAAIEHILVSLQPDVYNLAARMLGDREDARDATQEILLKVTTHLSSFKGESALGTWVYRIASNHLLNVRTKAREHPQLSLDAMDQELAAGLALSASLNETRALLPEDKLEARRIALSCTQAMLMSLDRDHRIVLVLEVVLGLDSQQSAAVLGISPEAVRKRLSRARERLDTFMNQRCGLVNEQAACHCTKQVAAVRWVAKNNPEKCNRSFTLTAQELDEAETGLRELIGMSDAMAVFRGHPKYKEPSMLIPAIKAVIESGSFLQ